ncbi:MAG: AEC family transporter [Oscillospiraceae bacterium]|nr:AEC family transporter [Oscillospiraceae bacterium]
MREHFLVSLNAVLPVFFIMAAGYLAKRVGIIQEQDIFKFNRVAFRVFMPVMLFKNIYASDLKTAVRPALLLYAITGVLISYVLIWLAVHASVKNRDKKSVLIQGMFRSNLAIIGVPIAESLTGGGDVSAVAVTMAVIVPIFNVLAVICLEAYSEDKIRPGRMLLEVIKNPLIIGSALGLLVLLLKIRLPAACVSAVNSVAGVASPLMLFTLGAFFRFDRLKSNAVYHAAVCAVRLLVVPAAALLPAMALGFRGIEMVSLFAVFAAPTAANSFTMAQQMGGDGELAGEIVITTSLFCVVTMFGWIFLLKNLGVF